MYILYTDARLIPGAKIMVAKAKQTSGSAYLRNSGRKPIGVSAWPLDHALIRQAAAVEGCSMAQFCLDAALERAKNIFKKNQK